MSKDTLHLLSRDGLEVLFLRVEDHKVVELRVVEGLQSTMDRWIAEGVVEWVGPEEEKRQRVTTIDDDAFVERLGDYITSQSGFVRADG